MQIFINYTLNAVKNIIIIFYITNIYKTEINLIELSNN